jgi:hypothetical protein
MLDFPTVYNTVGKGDPPYAIHFQIARSNGPTLYVDERLARNVNRIPVSLADSSRTIGFPRTRPRVSFSSRLEVRELTAY